MRLAVDFVSINASQSNQDLIKLSHHRGNAVHVGTVNYERCALRLVEVGADNLTTDEPALLVNLREQLRELNRAELSALALSRNDAVEKGPPIGN